MSLLTEERVQGAISLLKSLGLRDLLSSSAPAGRESIQANVNLDKNGKEKERESGLQITLKGLESMHALTKTSVLYTSPLDENGYLRSFCQKLKDAFSEAGFLVEDKRPLLLHATLVNTVYVPGVRGKGSGDGHGKRCVLTFSFLFFQFGFGFSVGGWEQGMLRASASVAVGDANVTKESKTTIRCQGRGSEV
jgi:activating signal cointegrator complex subunit 1